MSQDIMYHRISTSKSLHVCSVLVNATVRCLCLLRTLNAFNKRTQFLQMNRSVKSPKTYKWPNYITLCATSTAVTKTAKEYSYRSTGVPYTSYQISSHLPAQTANSGSYLWCLVTMYNSHRL
jgi:hypothetical protein